MKKKIDLPNDRTEWAKVTWQESQTLLSQLLSLYNFMRFEELRIDSGNRADIVVIRTTDEEVIFGVIEVKTYSKLNSTIIKDALKQVCRYISGYYDIVNENNKWGNRKKRYFGSVVYTNDYPITKNAKSRQTVRNSLPQYIRKNKDVHIFSSRPEELISLLQSKNLCGYAQNSLNDYLYED